MKQILYLYNNESQGDEHRLRLQGMAKNRCRDYFPGGLKGCGD